MNTTLTNAGAFNPEKLTWLEIHGCNRDIPKSCGSVVYLQDRYFQFYVDSKVEVWMGHDLGWCEVVIEKDKQG